MCIIAGLYSCCRDLPRIRLNSGARLQHQDQTTSVSKLPKPLKCCALLAKHTLTACFSLQSSFNLQQSPLGNWNFAAEQAGSPSNPDIYKEVGIGAQVMYCIASGEEGSSGDISPTRACPVDHSWEVAAHTWGWRTYLTEGLNLCFLSPSRVLKSLDLQGLAW